MGALTETEIFARMSESFRIAAECCDALVILPAAGPSYIKLREHLKLIEGCCRQAAHWREDSRWLPIGLKMEEAHQRAGDWLRKHYARKMFLTLAVILRAGGKSAIELRDKAPPNLGTILPEMQADPTERHRPVQVIAPGQEQIRVPARKPSIIIPPGVTLQ